MNPAPSELPGAPDFLETADRIAHRLCRDAVWAGDACTWLGWTTSKGNQRGEPVFATVGPELYAGTAGIALFLTRYLQLCESPQIEVVLRGAVAHAQAGLAALPGSHPGLHDGAVGICHALIEAGVVLEDPLMVEGGLRQLGEWVADELAATSLDVIDGRAGIIPVLLQVACRFNRDTLLAKAVEQGEQLVRLAERSDDGWSWPTMPEGAERNVTGFSHGTAGIATAFVELHHYTGDARFLTAASEGWRYERSCFSREQNNWPDYRLAKPEVERPRAQRARCGTAWCHGAPGIGLSRLRAWELGHRDDKLADEIESAMAATHIWFERNEHGRTEFSLCHGIAGNAELFVAASQILERPELHEVAALRGRRGMRKFEGAGEPWPCGGTRVGETPNLMLGLAGIGLFYLRLSAPRQVESVLLIRSSLPAQSDEALPRQ